MSKLKGSRIKITLSCISFLLLILSFLVVPGVGDTFTGSGSKTTATFTSSGIVKIVWSTTYDSPDFAMFSFFVYEQGNSIFKELFNGLEGTSYYYDDGTLYFDVSAANLNSWTITTSDTSGEYGTSFSGSGSINTKLFTSSGNVKITWTSTYDDEAFALFNVFTYKVGSSIFKDSFNGLSGDTFFYQAGDFYFAVSAANLNSWTITVEDLGGTTTTDTTTKTGGSQTTDAVSPGFELALVLSVMSLLTIKLKAINNKKRTK